MTAQSIPTPDSDADCQRQAHSRERRQVLYQEHAALAQARVIQQMGRTRTEAIGEADLSSNVMLDVNTALAVQYARTPVVAADGDLAERIKQVGLWNLMQRVQRDTGGLREMLVHVDVGDDGEPSYRPVFPDMVEADSGGDRPGEPNVIREYVEREDPQEPGKRIWTINALDIRDPENPSFRILDGRRGDGGERGDMTSAYLGGPKSGSAYPYRFGDGRPFINYELYHAAETGALWDSYEQRGLFEGTLNAIVLWTFFGHCVKNASWPQRYIAGLIALGAKPEGDSTDLEFDDVVRSGIVTDPTTVLQFMVDRDHVGQPLIGQWAPSVDPVALQQSIEAYERLVGTRAGLSGADIQKTSGDPRSGYALAISRDAIREKQRASEDLYRRSDLRLIQKTAALLSRAGPKRYSEKLGRITYEGVPLSAAERAALDVHIKARLDTGMIDPVEAYLEYHPELTEDQALEKLLLIEKRRAQLAAARASAPGANLED